MAKLFDTAHLDEKLMASLSGNEASWIYNGLDCCITAEIFNELDDQLQAEPESVQETYRTALAKHAPIMEMSLRGVRIDESSRQETLRALREQLKSLDTKFQRIMQEVWGTELNWNSPTQVKNLFYGMLGLKEIRKRNSNGQYVATVNREALEYFQIYHYARPLAAFVLTMRDISKAISFLKTELDSDNRIRTNYNIAGTNTGRLSSSAFDFGTGCVRPSAEALTKHGWVALQKLKDGDEIAQWNNGQVEFAEAQFYWTDFDGQLAQYQTEQIQLAVTPGHRMLWRNYHNEHYMTTPAAQTAFKRQVYIPLGGKAVSGTMEIPRYVAMLLADFSKEGTQWRGAFKKARKQKRFLELTEEFNLNFTEQKAKPGYRRFALKEETDWPVKWGPWVLSLTYESGRALVDEAKFWDGHVRGKSFLFFSADKEQAEWFQTLCHLVGYSTTLRSAVNSDAAYGNNFTIYTVNVKPRDEAQVLKKHWSLVDYKGPVGCPQVPSSYWLVRENGYISVTGNTNLQNVDRNFRYPFVPDPGMYFVNIDLEQADARNVAARIWQIFYESHGEDFAGMYLNAAESGDLHTFVCRMAWTELDWPEEQSGWRAVADQTAYRGKSYRDLAKALGHGTNYYGTPRTMAKHTHTERKIIEEFQKKYFAAFPGISAWHEWVINEIKSHGTLYNLFGRRRMFFGRGNDPSTHRKAIAYDPQSSTGEQIDRGLLAVWRRFDQAEVQLLAQVHDSILFQVPYRRAEELIPAVLETMKVEIELKGGRLFHVPLEAKTGWNWGDFDPQKNPYGLDKWRGHEPRKRPSPKRRFTDYL